MVLNALLLLVIGTYISRAGFKDQTHYDWDSWSARAEIAVDTEQPMANKIRQRIILGVCVYALTYETREALEETVRRLEVVKPANRDSALPLWGKPRDDVARTSARRLDLRVRCVEVPS